ncbi:CDP-glucose 4,6-dehydratase [Alphaproteobacteria bacterium]|nr:CDP-glucose 4,6-dehydratase [Alphaproteobacteria bacterium]
MIYENLKQKFSGKTIAITGNTGFKGSWLSLWLKDLGAKVYGFSNQDKHNNKLFSLANIENEYETTFGDVASLELVKSWINRVQPDLVFHFAAEAVVARAQTNPQKTFNTNTLGTVNVLEAVGLLEKDVDVVISTTDKVYRNQEEGRPFCEASELGGNEPYSASKVCAEIAANSYRHSFMQKKSSQLGIKKVVTVRAGNVIGGGDWSPYRLVSSCVDACTFNTPLTLRSPESIRPWQHVLDAIYGYLIIAAAMRDGVAMDEAYNLGPVENDFLKVKQFAECFVKNWGATGVSIETSTSPFTEAGILVLDSTLVREKLKWMPSYDVATSIQKTVDWFKALESGQDAKSLMRSDLTCYQQL